MTDLKERFGGVNVYAIPGATILPDPRDVLRYCGAWDPHVLASSRLTQVLESAGLSRRASDDELRRWLLLALGTILEDVREPWVYVQTPAAQQAYAEIDRVKAIDADLLSDEDRLRREVYLKILEGGMHDLYGGYDYVQWCDLWQPTRDALVATIAEIEDDPDDDGFYIGALRNKLPSSNVRTDPYLLAQLASIIPASSRVLRSQIVKAYKEIGRPGDLTLHGDGPRSLNRALQLFSIDGRGFVRHADGPHLHTLPDFTHLVAQAMLAAARL